MKSPDKYAIPLCNEDHRRLHAHGNETEFLALEGVDAHGWIEKTEHDHEAQ